MADLEGLLGWLGCNVGILESHVLHLLLGLGECQMLHVLLELLFLSLLFHQGNDVRSFLWQSPNEIIVTSEIEAEIKLQVLF